MEYRKYLLDNRNNPENHNNDPDNIQAKLYKIPAFTATGLDPTWGKFPNNKADNDLNE